MTLNCGDHRWLGSSAVGGETLQKMVTFGIVFLFLRLHKKQLPSVEQGYKILYDFHKHHNSKNREQSVPERGCCLSSRGCLFIHKIFSLAEFIHIL